MAAASVGSLFALLAEAVPGNTGWEDLTLKGLLLLAVLYLVREITRLREEAKKDSSDREDRTNHAIMANTAAMNELTAVVREQATFSQHVLNVIVSKAVDKPEGK